MWGANNANDCMQLHNTKKSFDFGYFAPSYNASVHSTYGIPACYAYVYSTEPQNFSPPNGRKAICQRPSTNRLTAVNRSDDGRKALHNIKTKQKKHKAFTEEMPCMYEPSNILSGYE